MVQLTVVDREGLIDWSRQLLAELGDRVDKATLQAVKSAQEALLADRFCLAVMGKAKRGKSTLINALLGRQDDLVAPVDKLPVSSAISRFRWSEKEGVTVVFRDGRRQEIGFDQIREFVTEELNPENRKGVNFLEIQGPFPGLEHGFELVDTPGAASLHEHHDALLHAFIPQADAVIFLVTARMPLDQDEIELLQKVKAADIQKIFFAINRVDECSEPDIQEAISYNLNLLSRVGIPVSRMHRISAKQAFRGNLEKSGLGELLSEISDFIAHHRAQVITARFVSRVCSAVHPLMQAIDVEAAASQKTLAEIESELRQLRQRKAGLEREREMAEREFKVSWGRAVDQFSLALGDAEQAVVAEATQLIASTTIFGVAKLAKELPTKLTDLLEGHLRPVATQFEETARAACERLQISYPQISIGENVQVSITPKATDAALLGTVGGVATAAAGASFAMAGASTAASIAAANAAALAATQTVVAPSIASMLVQGLGLEFLAPLFTGVTTVSAPAALTTTPFWVAIAGPVGWTLAGLGTLAIPFSWRHSKIKQKGQLEQAAREHIDHVFRHIKEERVPVLRQMATNIVEEIRIQFDRQISSVEETLQRVSENRSSAEQAEQVIALARRLQKLMEQGRAFCGAVQGTAS